MRLPAFAILAAFALSGAILATTTKAEAYICRQPVDGLDSYTDCYGNQLSGVSLRAAQIEELLEKKETPDRIQMALGLSVVTVRSATDACPRPKIRIGSTTVSAGAASPVYDVQCAY